MKELGVSGKDRLYHEVTTLVEILYQGGTYDQLITIVETTSKGLDSSKWETARHYTGTSTIFDLAPHELRAYVTGAAKDEAEIDSMRTRGRYGGRAAEAVAVGGLPRLDDMATAGVKRADKDKGKRKTKDGRGGDVQLGVVAAGAVQGP